MLFAFHPKALILFGVVPPHPPKCSFRHPSVRDVLSPHCGVPTSHRHLLIFTAVLFVSSKAFNNLVQEDLFHYPKNTCTNKKK
jgi:hypothetical protein